MSGMTRYIIRRIAQAIVTIFFIISLNFLIINLAPGNPVTIMAGEIAASDPEYMKAMMQRWGLDKPIHERFFIYICKILQGDFGFSYRYTMPVMKLIAERVLATLMLMLTSLFIGFFVGIFLGAFSARRFQSKIDTALSFGSLVLYSMPTFWFGLVLILIFSVNLRLFPIAGMVSVRETYTGINYWIDVLKHMFLPATALALGTNIPMYYKITRSSVLEQTKEDYVATFISYGIDEDIVFKKYILRNAILPPITMLGIALGFILSGTALVETVFAWPGLGSLLLIAAQFRDYPLLMGIYLITAIGVTTASFLTDITYTLLDPRVKYR